MELEINDQRPTSLTQRCALSTSLHTSALSGKRYSKNCVSTLYICVQQVHDDDQQKGMNTLMGVDRECRHRWVEHTHTATSCILLRFEHSELGIN